jgi:hypothetical protein
LCGFHGIIHLFGKQKDFSKVAACLSFLVMLITEHIGVPVEKHIKGLFTSLHSIAKHALKTRLQHHARIIVVRISRVVGYEGG